MSWGGGCYTANHVAHRSIDADAPPAPGRFARGMNREKEAFVTGVKALNPLQGCKRIVLMAGHDGGDGEASLERLHGPQRHRQRQLFLTKTANRDDPCVRTTVAGIDNYRVDCFL